MYCTQEQAKKVLKSRELREMSDSPYTDETTEANTARVEHDADKHVDKERNNLQLMAEDYTFKTLGKYLNREYHEIFTDAIEGAYIDGATEQDRIARQEEHQLLLTKMRDWLDDHISDCVMRYNLVQQFDNDSKEVVI